MAEILDHPILGRIRGISQNGVRQYLGLQYATLDHRFAKPMIVTAYNVAETDATKFGPAALSSVPCEAEHSLIQARLPHGDFSQSELSCLNLNVTVPEEAVDNLPVFIFIHGGGFRLGSNAWPQFDLARFVRLSSASNQPVIGITINYRLGAFGFLSSQEMTDAGMPANRGLLDQQVAFKWVRRHIAGFGGDSNNITIIGQSAGAAACTFHLQSELPLFERMACMGGTSLLMKALPPAAAESAYTKVLEHLQIQESAPAVRLKALIERPASDFLADFGPQVPLTPILDGATICSNLTYAQFDQADGEPLFPGQKWCKAVLMGNCAYDGGIFANVIGPRQAGIAKSFSRCVRNTLTGNEAAAQKLLNGYRISDSISDDVALKHVLEFVTDIAFYVPLFKFAALWPGRAYIFHFNEPNPWDGPFKGLAMHILDVAFLFQNYNDQLDETQRESAISMAAAFTAFISGQEPFAPFNAQKGGPHVYGPTGRTKYAKGEEPEHYDRQGIINELGQAVGFDLLASIWTSFVFAA